MSRRLYLHIGYPKTGTTALQESLFVNREVLMGSGLLYPLTGVVKYSHHQFPWVLTDDHRRDEQLTMQRLFDSLEAEIKDEAPSEIVISSEGFVFAMDPDELKSFFEPIFDEIVLVIYIRQPMRWIRSDYNQGVKGWRRLSCSYHEHLKTIISIGRSPLNYFNRISGWAGAFGWNNIKLRSYDMCKNNLVSSFLDIMNRSDLVDALNLPRRDSNPRLGFKQQELVRVVNTMNIDMKERARYINEILSRIGNDDCSLQVESYRDDALIGVLRKLNKQNEKLLKYFDGGLFEDDFFSLADDDVIFYRQADVSGVGDTMIPLFQSVSNAQ